MVVSGLTASRMRWSNDNAIDWNSSHCSVVCLSQAFRFAACFLGLATAQENEAEKLFRAVEEKIKSAKAVQVSFEVEFKGKDKEAGSRVTIWTLDQPKK